MPPSIFFGDLRARSQLTLKVKMSSINSQKWLRLTWARINPFLGWKHLLCSMRMEFADHFLKSRAALISVARKPEQNGRKKLGFCWLDDYQSWQWEWAWASIISALRLANHRTSKGKREAGVDCQGRFTPKKLVQRWCEFVAIFRFTLILAANAPLPVTCNLRRCRDMPTNCPDSRASRRTSQQNPKSSISKGSKPGAWSLNGRWSWSRTGTYQY